jgi:uncharacterized protein
VGRLKDRLRRQLGDPAELAKKGRSELPETAADQPEGDVPWDKGVVLERLRRLHKASSRQAEPRRPVEVVRPVRRTDPNRPVTEPPSVPRRPLEGAGTACLHGELVLPPGTRHGGLALDEVLRVDGPLAVLLSGDPDLSTFDPTRALFFDLETTGLMGGAGNLAFLSGGVRIDEEGEVTVHQLMIRDPSEEPAALEYMAGLLADVDFLVSFNGKSFDRNVLADRFTMNRMRPERVLELPHLDLLHPARRLFRQTHESCSLGSLEEHRLGVFRCETEVRGAEVPERWFDFLRTGRFELVEPVIDHNVLDLLSLLTLAAHLARCVEAPGAALPEPTALVSAARLLLERGEEERAEEVLELLTRGAADEPVVYGALGIYAEHLRRTERHGRALELWRRMMGAAGVADLAPWRAASIALEWRLDRKAEALELVDDVLDRVGDDPLAELEVEEFRRRRQRLVGKLAR